MFAGKFHLVPLAGPALALLGALGAHAPAWSEPVVAHVFTRASVGVAGNNAAVACYNHGACALTGVGPEVVNGPQPNGVATAQSGGNFDGSSTAQGSGVTVRGGVAGATADQYVQAQANASANMADGTLHAATSNTGVSSFFTESAGGTAMAQITDTLRFTRVGSAEPAHIGVTFSIDGVIATTGTDFSGFVETYFHLGGYAARAQFQAHPGADPLTELFDTHAGPSGWGHWTWTQHADTSWEGVFTGDIVMTTDTLDLALDMKLEMTCSNGASCDFGHTARAGLTLPGTVRMTSASGQFLTAPDPGTDNNVPEPASMLLALAALGSLRALGGQRAR